MHPRQHFVGVKFDGRRDRGAVFQKCRVEMPEENDSELKVLVFTEFIPTQAMLAEFLESRGFSVATLNGTRERLWPQTLYALG